MDTRTDPHAQARHARSQPLLLHSMSVFREIFEIVFARREIRTVVEVGVESGKVSSLYAELGASAVYCIDPRPDDDIRANLADDPALQLVEKASPDVLPEVPVGDLYVLDGDHNYSVVHREVSWLLRNAPDAVIVLHDMLWPCGRRDQYYEPSTLPPEQRQPISTDGTTVWHDKLTPAGLVGLGAFTVAEHAGGERNGVRTAVEDAMAGAPEPWHLEVVPAVFGMGILVRQSAPGAGKLIEGLRPYTTSRLLAVLENNRIALYTRMLQMQYDLVAQADDADRLAETATSQRREIERLRRELHAAAAEHADDTEHLHREIRQLRHQLNDRFRPRLAAKLTDVAQLAATRLRKNGLRT